MNKNIHVPRIPKGCDQQGRHPEAAHAASEVDDYRPVGAGWVDCVMAVALGAAIAGVFVICWGWV